MGPGVPDLGLDDETVASVINGARTYSQFLDMVDKAGNGICPFCPDHFDASKNCVIGKHGHREEVWQAWRNPYPINHSSHHSIIAPARHITHLNAMTAEDWENMNFLIREIVKDLPGGCVAIRFGDPDLNAGSVRHLHVNIIVPDGTGDVQVTLAKNPQKQEEARSRVLAFEKLRSAGISVEDAPQRAAEILSSGELKIVDDRLK